MPHRLYLRSTLHPACVIHIYLVTIGRPLWLFALLGFYLVIPRLSPRWDYFFQTPVQSHPWSSPLCMGYFVSNKVTTLIFHLLGRISSQLLKLLNILSFYSITHASNSWRLATDHETRWVFIHGCQATLASTILTNHVLCLY